ncbi:LexA family protein [Streptomyces sp. NPDC057253]|uniref:LexA family protein n=1 Tax=Streptomyces sp. NPDC057253 TaxID=3346069 RepID=UPI00362CD004
MTTHADSAPRTNALTEMQWRIYHFIRDALQLRGYAPTLREIGANVGLQPPSVRHHLQQLKAAGVIRYEPKKTRTYEIVNAQETPPLPPLRHVGCPALTTGEDQEPESPVILRVALSPALSRALKAGALLTVQHLNLANGANPRAGVFGQVTAVTHPVGSAHPS